MVFTNPMKQVATEDALVASNPLHRDAVWHNGGIPLVEPRRNERLIGYAPRNINRQLYIYIYIYIYLYIYMCVCVYME